MENKSQQQGTSQEGGMRKGKCRSVCRTGKLSTISRGEENQRQCMEARTGVVTQKRLVVQNLGHGKWPDCL